jgi:hypothetical protein
MLRNSWRLKGYRTAARLNPFGLSDGERISGSWGESPSLLSQAFARPSLLTDGVPGIILTL